MNYDEADALLGTPEGSLESHEQPCEECRKVERAVLIAAAGGGILLGVGLAYLILRRK